MLLLFWSVLAVQTAHGCRDERSDAASSYPPPPDPGIYPGEPIVPTEGVGYLSGFSSVSPTGQYTYQIPLGVPPGRAGMEPVLALHYASGAGNGLLGLGWSLSGLSEIRRCRKTVATEGGADGIDYDTTDAFCLDGQKLRQVHAKEVQNGEDGAEYRTERDSERRIVAHTGGAGKAGPDSFTVQAKDGKIFEYGTRVEPHRMRGGFPNEEIADLGAVRAAWLLTSARDRSGNAIAYDYDISTDPATKGIDYRIHAIRYTLKGEGSGGDLTGG